MAKRRFANIELATVGNDPYNFGMLPTFGGKTRLLPRDRILVEKGGLTNEGIEVYLDLFTDTQVFSAWDKQCSEITSRKLIISPGGDEPIDIEAKEYVESVLENLSLMQEDCDSEGLAITSNAQGMDGLTKGLAVASLTGIAFGEVVWYEDRDGNPSLKKVVVRDPRRFIFEHKDNKNYLKLTTLRHRFNGIYVPARKFIVHRHWAIPTDDVYGSGLGRMLFYPVEWKKELLTLWLTLVDKYTDPTVVGTYDEEIDRESKKDFEEAVCNIGRDMYMTMPSMFDLDFKNPNLSNADLLQQLLEVLDSYISKVITGESNTGERGGGGVLRENVSNSIRLMKAKALSDQITDTLNRTLVKWITFYKFGSKAKPPKLHRNFRDVEGTLQTLQTLKQLGYNSTPEFVEELTGVPINRPKPKKSFAVG